MVYFVRKMVFWQTLSEVTHCGLPIDDDGKFIGIGFIPLFSTYEEALQFAKGDESQIGELELKVNNG